MDKDFLLIKKMKNGDESAMESFVCRYYPKILCYCHYHVADKGYAEDITQETFVKFFGSLSTYRHHGKALNYLYTIAANLCRDFYKKSASLPIPDIPDTCENLMDSVDCRMDMEEALNRLHYVERGMGIFAPVFVILLIPEFWKNRSSDSEEVEGAAFYSLRQIYSARMLLFGMADFFLLSLFCGAVSATVQLTAEEMLIQFFLPLNVTCCICFSVLCCRRYGSEYMAVALSLLWIAVWILIVLNEAVYTIVARPVWWFMLLVSFSYMAGMIFCFLRGFGKDLEGKVSWN